MDNANDLAQALAQALESPDPIPRALLWRVQEYIAQLSHKRGGLHLGARDDAATLGDDIDRQCQQLGINIYWT